MRVQCSPEALLQGVQITSRAVSSRASIPILGNILLDAGGETLKITATDLELGIEAHKSRP